MGVRNVTARLSKEAGNVLFAFFLSLPMLFGFLAFGVDAVNCLTVKGLQNDALQTALNVQKSPTTSLLAKNSDDPGLQIAEATVQALRAQGYAGRIDVWFCEQSRSESDETETTRLLLFQTDVADYVETSFGALFGANGILIETSEPSYLMPYSEYEAWKPAHARIGRFRCEEGSSSAQIGFDRFSISEMPERMMEQDFRTPE